MEPAPPRSPFDVTAVRAHFPSLGRTHQGGPVAYLDGPAGTQVPVECIRATAGYWESRNANTGGAFANSLESDALVEEAHAAAADFIGATDPGKVGVGPNMTTLTFAVSRRWASPRPEDGARRARALQHAR